MKKNNFYKVLLIPITTGILFLLFLHWRAVSAVESFLDRKIPSHIPLTYDNLNVNILKGKIAFTEVDLKIQNRNTSLYHTKITADKITINGLSYWSFFVLNTVNISELSIENPTIVYDPSKRLKEQSKTHQGVVKLLKKIAINKLSIINGSFDMLQHEGSMTKVSAKKINFKLKNSKTDPKIINQKIPITYDSYDFSAEELFVDLGKYELVKAAKISISETDAVLTDLVLRSKQSKIELSKIINLEHDHINLSIAKTTLDAIDIGFVDDAFFFHSELGKIDTLNLELYRDKLKVEKKEKKRMYSQMLRELPFDLKIDSVYLANGKIAYEEQTAYETKAGRIFFDDVSLDIQNLCNSEDLTKVTFASMSGKLMGEAPITLGYKFHNKDKSDAFTLNASLFNLNGSKVNSFLRPNLNTKVNGKIVALYLTVSGNSIAAKGQMKMKYSNLNFKILKKDRLHINKLFSAIGNIFTNDGSDTDAAGYRHGQITVERDPTKSFFSYVWLATQDGLLSTIVGNGKKE